MSGAAGPEAYEEVEEGAARMRHPKGNAVFYNPVQVYNRDLSIAVIQTFAELRLRERFVATEAKRLRREAAAHANEGTAPAEAAGDAAAAAKEAAEASAQAEDWPARARDTASERGLRVLDALAASGLRSVRYAKEIWGIKEVVVNDLSAAAVELAQQNAEANGCNPSVFRVSQGDALDVMYAARAAGAQKFDVIDLDPYGTAAPFLDAAVQAVAPGGLLCVTCTDLRSLTGAEPGSAYSRYGGIPARAKYQHEMALRLVLQALDAAAGRYRRGVSPLLSVAPDFYLRVFVRVWDAPQMATTAPLRRAHVLQSSACPSFWIQPVAKRAKTGQDKYGPSVLVETIPPPSAGSAETVDGVSPSAINGGNGHLASPSYGRVRIAGPMYSASLHDHAFLDALSSTLERLGQPGSPARISQAHRIDAALDLAKLDLPDVPLFYSVSDLCSTLHCSTLPTATLEAAIRGLGYRFGPVPRDGSFFKTDAPPHIIWDVLRKWVELHPLGEKRRAEMEKKKDAAYHILRQPCTVDIDFSTLNIGKVAQQRKQRKARYLPNPEENWGPKPAAAVISKRPREMPAPMTNGTASMGGHDGVAFSPPPPPTFVAQGPKIEGLLDEPPKKKKRSGRPVRQLCRAFTTNTQAPCQACTRFAKRAGLCTPHVGATLLGPVRRLRRSALVELEFDEQVNIEKDDLKFYLSEQYHVKRREAGAPPLTPVVQEMHEIAWEQQAPPNAVPAEPTHSSGHSTVASGAGGEAAEDLVAAVPQASTPDPTSLEVGGGAAGVAAAEGPDEAFVGVEEV